MSNPIKESLRKAVSFLETRRYRYALIGGIANQIWGQARFTHDIDIKVLVSDTKYDLVSEDIRKSFPVAARSEISNPLIVPVRIDDVIVDFLLTAPGYEEQIVLRAVEWMIEDLKVHVCTPEDLIIQKAITGRQKDWQDIQGIIIEQYHKIDRSYVEFWLEQFAEALDQFYILDHYHRIWNQLNMDHL